MRQGALAPLLLCVNRAQTHLFIKIICNAFEFLKARYFGVLLKKNKNLMKKRESKREKYRDR